MPNITLSPCLVGASYFTIDSKAPTQTLNLESFKRQFIFENDLQAQYKISLLREGAFLGVSRTVRGNKLFILMNPDRSGNMDWVLSKDPDFMDRVQSVFRVQSLDWEASIREPQ